jgi:hypothetical protein
LSELNAARLILVGVDEYRMGISRPIGISFQWGFCKNPFGQSMFNPTLIVIEAFIRELRTMYERTYGVLEPSYPGILSFVAQLALENIATSDAAYHDVNHTIMVTLVAQEILRGRHISVGGVTPREWLHFIVSLLGDDIGYVRGFCRGDRDGSIIDPAGDRVTLPEGPRRINGAVSLCSV